MTALANLSPSVSVALDERSKYLRRLSVRALDKGERGHIGSTMSLIEILRVLYDDILRFRPADPAWTGRDRMILSKGHGCIALYVMLADKGFFPLETLDTFCHRDSILGGHPEQAKIPGVEASTRAFGFAPIEVDGHDVAELRKVFERCPLDHDRPAAIICHTVKGKGIPFAEHDPTWHHKAKVPPDTILDMYKALE